MEACGADFDIGGPWVEQTARASCMVGEILRRNSAFSVVGDGRCKEAWRRVALRCAASAVFSPSLLFGTTGRKPSLIPGIFTRSSIESHPHVSTGAEGA